MANRRKYLDKSSKARLADRHRMTRIARRSDLDDSRAHCKSIFTSGLFLTGRPSRFSSRIAFLITFIRLSSALARRLDSPMVTRPDLRSAKFATKPQAFDRARLNVDLLHGWQRLRVRRARYNQIPPPIWASLTNFFCVCAGTFPAPVSARP